MSLRNKGTNGGADASTDASNPLSHKGVATSSPAYAVNMTMADAWLSAQASGKLSKRELRDCGTALNTVLKALGRESLSDIQANPEALAAELFGTAFWRLGRGKKRRHNILSNLRKVLALAGIIDGREVTHGELSDDWAALMALCPDNYQRFKLSRFAAYYSAKGMAPQQLDGDDAIPAFEAWLCTRTLTSDIPYKVSRVASAWNVNVGVVPGWPATELKVPNRSKAYSLPLAAFPASFSADLAAFLKYWKSPRDLERALPGDDHSDVTLEAYRQFAVRAATILVKSGTPAEEIRSLADIVTPNAVEIVLDFLDARAGGKKNSQASTMGTYLGQIAEYWVEVSADDLARIRKLAKGVRKSTRGMSDRVRMRVGQMLSPSRVHNMAGMAWKLADDARKLLPTAPQRAAQVHEEAVAIALVLHFAFRRRTLNLLRLDDLKRDERGRINYLFVDSGRVKNRKAIEGEIGSELASLIKVHLTTYRPLRPGAAKSPWLFPAEGGDHLHSASLANRLSRTMSAELGTKCSVHMIRHLIVSLILTANPDAIGFAQAMLGHRSHKTTESQYGDVRQMGATARWSKQLLEDMKAGGLKLSRKGKPKAANSAVKASTKPGKGK